MILFTTFFVFFTKTCCVFNVLKVRIQQTYKLFLNFALQTLFTYFNRQNFKNSVFYDVLQISKYLDDRLITINNVIFTVCSKFYHRILPYLRKELLCLTLPKNRNFNREYLTYCLSI